MDEKIIKAAVERHREQVAPPYGELLDKLGYEAVNEFIKAFGGLTVYVPTRRSVYRSCIETDIVQNNRHKHVSELVRVYGFSESHVRRLLAKKQGLTGELKP